MPDKPIYTFLFTFPDNWDDMERDEQGRVIIHQFQETARNLKLPLTHVKAEYEGSGDSFNGCEWHFYGTGSSEPLDISIELGHDAYDTLSKWIDEWVSDHSLGWENNEGGHGSVEFIIVDPVGVTLDHNEFFTDSRNVVNTELFEKEE